MSLCDNCLRKSEGVGFDSVRNQYLISNHADADKVAIDIDGKQSAGTSAGALAADTCLKVNLTYVCSGLV
jgi:hypothetical protein